MDVECAVVDDHVGVESTSDATSSREESSPLFLRVSSSYLLVAGRILHLVLNDSVDLVEALEGLDSDDEMESLRVDLLGIIEAQEFHKKTDAALFVFEWATKKHGLAELFGYCEGGCGPLAPAMISILGKEGRVSDAAALL